MTRLALCFALSSCVLVANTAFAQTQAPDAAENAAVALKSKLMSVDLTLNFGMSPVTVMQAGHKLDLGFFGGNAERYFSAVPEALEALESYRTRRIVGFTMWSVGLAALLGDIAFIAASASPSGTLSDSEAGVAAGLLLGGAVLGLTGAIVFQSANGALTDGVNRYNAAVLNQFLPPSEKIDLRLLLSSRQQGVALRYSF